MDIQLEFTYSLKSEEIFYSKKEAIIKVTISRIRKELFFAHISLTLFLFKTNELLKYVKKGALQPLQRIIRASSSHTCSWFFKLKRY